MKRPTSKPPNTASPAGLGWRRLLVALILAGVAGLAWLVFSLSGAKDQDYLDVMNDQEVAWKEMTEILKAVKDETSMTEAKITLEKSAEKYAAISRRANLLPKPPPRKVQEQLKQNSDVMEWTLRQLQKETSRIGKLPGGPEFLKQFESTKGLLNAVQP